MLFEIDPRRGGGANGRPAAESAAPGAGSALEGESGENPVDDFAREVAEASDAQAVERALTSAARRLTGSGSARLVPLQKRGLVPGFEVAPVAARRGARVWGWLVVDQSAERLGERDNFVRRRLETLGIIAGDALDRAEARTRASLSTPADRPLRRGSAASLAVGWGLGSSQAQAVPSAPGLYNETFLHAVLPLFFNQAKRHGEPLSVLYVAVDRLEAIRGLLGAEQADRTTRGVGLAIASRIRSSDFVARLDDHRIVAVLPRADLDGALVVARKLRRAVADEAELLSDAPGLTISIGAAAYPSRALDLGGLHNAAASALSAARTLGGNRAETAPPPPSPSVLLPTACGA